MTQIDPVELTIINNSFVNICREMGITMTRTAFSPIFNEGLDFSCVLFDKRGNMIGQAEFCPAQLAASLFIVRWTVEELGVDSFEPGDVVLHNDPYRGGAHIPEHSVIRPVFHDGELWGFVANVVNTKPGSTVPVKVMPGTAHAAIQPADSRAGRSLHRHVAL